MYIFFKKYYQTILIQKSAVSGKKSYMTDQVLNLYFFCKRMHYMQYALTHFYKMTTHQSKKLDFFSLQRYPWMPIKRTVLLFTKIVKFKKLYRLAFSRHLRVQILYIHNVHVIKMFYNSIFTWRRELTYHILQSVSKSRYI